MASSGLPPPPINDQPGSFTWLEWYRQLRNYISSSGSVPWYVIDFAGSNITDIALRDHNQLQNTQGGTSGEKYHLTAAEVLSSRNTIERVVPTTGFNNTISNTTVYYLVEPAGTLATGTIKMPAAPVDQQVVNIMSTQTITANGYAAWIYKTSTASWYRVN